MKKLNILSKTTGFIYQYDTLNYKLHDNKDELLSFFYKHLYVTNNCTNGNFIIFKVSDQQYHVAIKASFKMQDTIIHSFFPARAVVEHTLCNFWKDRVHLIFKV